jgi:acetolactate decarboxylase
MPNTDWFVPDWLSEAPNAPSFAVRDTLHKYGRYAPQTKTVTLSDLIRFHGHLCGGLMEAAMALRAACDALFPAGVIDRTDLTIVSNNSACGGDVATYLTGSRARFGSHSIDLTLSGGEFIVRRVFSGDTVHVSLRPEVHPHEVKAQMRKLLGGDYSPEDIDLFGRLQWDYARRLVQRPASESFAVEHLHDFVWPDPTCLDLGRRSDNDFKDAP